MPAIALLAVLLGALVSFTPDPNNGEDQKAKVEAANYLIYRNAVVLYATQNPGFSGQVPESSLVIADEWVNLRGWQNRVEAGKIYVYGEMSRSAAAHVAQMSDSAAIGINRSGVLEHPVWGSTGQSLPSYVPEGYIVSLVEEN